MIMGSGGGRWPERGTEEREPRSFIHTEESLLLRDTENEIQKQNKLQ